MGNVSPLSAPSPGSRDDDQGLGGPNSGVFRQKKPTTKWANIWKFPKKESLTLDSLRPQKQILLQKILKPFGKFHSEVSFSGKNPPEQLPIEILRKSPPKNPSPPRKYNLSHEKVIPPNHLEVFFLKEQIRTDCYCCA